MDKDKSTELETIAQIGKVNLKELVSMLVKTFIEKLDNVQQDVSRQIDQQVDLIMKISGQGFTQACKQLTESIKEAVQRVIDFTTLVKEYPLELKINPKELQNVSAVVRQQNPSQEPDRDEVYKPESLEHLNVRVARQMCGKCMIKFNNGIELSAHLIQFHKLDIHNRVAPVRKAYPTYTKLDQELLKYTCQMCQQTIMGPFWKYRYHLDKQHNIRDWFNCLDCQGKYNDVIELSKHIFAAHSKPLHTYRNFYRCKATMKDFFHPKEMQQHLVETMAYHRQVPDGYEQYRVN